MEMPTQRLQWEPSHYPTPQIHLISSWHCAKLYDFLQMCNILSELKKHHPASRVFYEQEDWEVFWIVCSSYALMDAG